MIQYYRVPNFAVVGLSNFLDQSEVCRDGQDMLVSELLGERGTRIVGVRNGKPVRIHYEQVWDWESCPLCGHPLTGDACYDDHGRRRCTNRVQPLSAANGWRRGTPLTENDLWWMRREHWKFAAISQEPDPDYNPEGPRSSLNAVPLQCGIYVVDDLVETEYGCRHYDFSSSSFDYFNFDD